MKIGVVGVGFMGQLHATTVHQAESTQLAAVVDLNEEVGRSVADDFATTYHRTVDDSLGDDAIDAYVVALPDRHHVEVTSALLRAGKPVLLEKPMAHDLVAAKSIAEAAREGSTRVMVGQLLRFDPRYVGAAQAVANGEIGEVLHATAGRIASRVVGTRMNGTSSVLFYLGVHDADAIQWVTGRRATRVYSRAVSKLMPSLGVQSEDAIFSTVDFDDGSVGQLFNGWTRTESDPVGIDGRLEVFGTEGSIEVDVRDHGLRMFGKSGLQVPDALHWPQVNGLIRGDLSAEVRHFAASVEAGEPFVVEPEDAMRAVALNDAILRSVESGQPEDVEPIS